jgi:lipopolysaccharide biosynthesis regulator YciM
MHQNLIERDDLPQDLQLAAVSELGQDYLKAGLLDRAEETFERLRGTTLDEEAKRNLLEIYQLGKDWERAIAIAKELPDVASRKEIAEYFCELAAAEMIRSRRDEARAHLLTALETNRHCVRASLLQGDLHAQEGNHQAAIISWQQIEAQNPAYLALVAQRLLTAYRAIERRDEGLQLLRDELRRNPTLLGFDKLLEARLFTASPEVRADIDLAKGIVQGYTRRLARYRCDNCGFKARQFYWRCPACGGWETYPPKRTEEFDLTP